MRAFSCLSHGLLPAHAMKGKVRPAGTDHLCVKQGDFQASLSDANLIGNGREEQEKEEHEDEV